MKYNSEEKVRNCLDNILVELEVFGEDRNKREEIKAKIIKTVNCYAEDYPSLVPDYKIITNKILDEYKK
ncbi:MAG: hypothetical protein KJ949_02675 [Nanoarchaeota archaeon]|nr:hypothetical protein [Nanoarchaeota archaeon]MBU4308631.1 hypothetical protein [Nanoarchaeota archaeon]